MKLTTLLLIIGIMQVSANTFAQKITLSEKNAPLVVVFDQISTQTGYDFVFTASTLKGAKLVTLDVNNEELGDVLKKIFDGQALQYAIKDKAVVISKKEANGFDKLTELFAAPADIKGIVTDSTGTPLTGATVKLEGSQQISTVAITDDFGNFRFNKIVPGTYQLVISYIGYSTLTKTIVLKDKDVSLNLTLYNSFTTLKAVSVLNNGYQEISAERATGAFDNIKKSQIDKPTPNIAERLIGQVAGLQLTQDADGNPKLELRGKSSLFASGVGLNPTNNGVPLIVVDGFPVTGTGLDPFSTINPNDVENITVLKDAAAASIWGARATNGVIVITTKHGKKGMPLKVEFSAFTRFAAKQNVNYLTGEASSADAVNFEQFAFNKWGAYPNDGTFNNGVFRVSSAVELMDENKLGFLTTAQLNAGLAQLSSQNNQQQVSDYLLSHPMNTQYNLSLSGGGQKISSYISMMAEQDQSNFKGNGNDKYAVNYRTNANVFKWLDFNLSGTFQLTKATSNGLQPYDLQQISPYDMLKNPDGSLTNIQQYYQPILNRTVPLSKFPYSFNYNPIQEIDNRSNVTTTINARIQASLTFKILSGLTATSSIQYENISNNNKDYQNDQTFYVRNLINTTSSWNQQLNGTVTPNLPLGGVLDQYRTSGETYNFRNQINFSKNTSDNNEINVVAGTEINNAVTQGYYYPTTYGYSDDALTVGGFPNGATGTSGWMRYHTNSFSYLPSYGYATQRFVSLFANASDTYLGKYTISGSYRTDASNLIATDSKYRYSPFYSAGVGYEISKENFMKNITWLNRLNIRATYGRTGNVDNSTSPYTLLNIISKPDPYTNTTVATINSHGNPELTWEKTTTLNLAVDYAVLNNKLYGKVDVYNKVGKDLLAQIPVPSVTGSTFAAFNSAAISNKGIEVTIGTLLPIKGNNITWSGSFTGSYNKSVITQLANSKYQASSIVQGGTQSYSEGYDPNSIWAYRYTGWQNANPTIAGPNGTFLPFDYNNAYRTDDGRSYLQNVGTLDPRYILGFTNSFKVYDFNVSFIIIAKLGAVFQSQYFNYKSTQYFEVPNSQVSKVLNGNPAEILTLPTDPNYQNYGAWVAYDRFLNYTYVSANLARLQEANISYNIPKRILAKANIRAAELILQGNNLYSWFANNVGEDPEYHKGTVKPTAQFTLGVKIEL